MINLKNISLTIHKAEILRDISWEIESDQKWVLFGKNGSGKTQLLKVITGYIHQTSGLVRRFNSEECGSDIRELRKRIGYMSSYLKDRIPPGETVLDVVLSGFFASIGLYEQVTPGQTRKARELLEMIHMGNFTARTFGTLSYGERQKVIILRSIIEDPDILILDEPTMGLDILSREEFLGILEKIASAGKLAMIYVTHHVEEIIPLFDRIYVLDEGETYYQGPVSRALEKNIIGSLYDNKVEIHNRDGRFYSILK